MIGLKFSINLFEHVIYLQLQNTLYFLETEDSVLKLKQSLTE